MYGHLIRGIAGGRQNEVSVTKPQALDQWQRLPDLNPVSDHDGLRPRRQRLTDGRQRPEIGIPRDDQFGLSPRTAHCRCHEVELVTCAACELEFPTRDGHTMEL